MYKRNHDEVVEPRFVSITGFMQFTGLGKTSAHMLAKEIGCVRKFGDRTLYDLKIADEFFDSNTNDIKLPEYRKSRKEG